jgi:hypothetical protein
LGVDLHDRAGEAIHFEQNTMFDWTSQMKVEVFLHRWSLGVSDEQYSGHHHQRDTTIGSSKKVMPDYCERSKRFAMRQGVEPNLTRVDNGPT